jgi:hypothetical protein
MDPTQTAPTQDHSQTAPPQGKTGSSSLGGARDIANRLDSFMQGRAGNGTGASKSELPLPPEKQKEKVTTDKPKVDQAKVTDPKDKATTQSPEKEKVGSDGLTKEERAQVVEFRKRAETAEARAKELEAKEAEGQASAKELAELKRLNKERETDYERNEREIAAVRIQGSKKYQETIAQPMQRLTTKIEEIAKGTQQDPDTVFNAIGIADTVKRNLALNEILEKMDPLTQDVFKQSVNALLDLEPKAAKLMSEAREAWQAHQLEEKQAKESEAQLKRETYLKASEEVWKVMQERLPALSDPEISKRVRERADKFDIYTAPEDIVAMAAQSAYSVGEMQAVIDKKDEEISQLKASIERLNGERVGPANGSTPAAKSGVSFNGSNSGERFEQWRKGA